MIVKHGGVYKQYLEGKTFVTHIIASNLTPKKREEFQKYKVVRPEWIVDCVKAGKILPWNQYRLIAQSSQATFGFSHNPMDSYRSVSSREEKVVYGGGGLAQTPAQPEPSEDRESSSYPTPPEMKSMEMDVEEPETKVEQHILMVDDESMDVEADGVASRPISDLQPEPTVESGEGPLELLETPNDLSHIDISSSLKIEHEIHSRQGRLWAQSPLQASGRPQLLSDQSPDVVPEAEIDPEEDTNIEDPIVPSVESPIIPHSRETSAPTVPKPHLNPADKAAAHNAALLANPSLRQNTVINPSFLKSYFDQSRLHHLSTWKADLKSQMQQLTSSRPPRRYPKSTERCIMHVDFDCFFCSVSLISRPELKDKPVCVGHGGGKSGEIASCNYVARKFGIHNGMLYEPLALSPAVCGQEN